MTSQRTAAFVTGMEGTSENGGTGAEAAGGSQRGVTVRPKIGGTDAITRFFAPLPKKLPIFLIVVTGKG